jgi:hypothetical protein
VHPVRGETPAKVRGIGKQWMFFSTHAPKPENVGAISLSERQAGFFRLFESLNKPRKQLAQVLTWRGKLNLNFLF